MFQILKHQSCLKHLGRLKGAAKKQRPCSCVGGSIVTHRHQSTSTAEETFLSVTPGDVPFPDSADVVIVGGGSAGCNTLYQLAKRGVKAVLLERAKVTAGETWHSSGLILQMRLSDLEIKMRSSTRSLIGGLHKETGIDPGWHNNGGLYVARSKVRLDEYKRVNTLAKNFGIETQLLDPEETKKLFPLLDSSMIKGALYCPSDGVVDPTKFCKALTTAALKQGAMVFEDCSVDQILVGTNHFGVKMIEGIVTSKGVIRTKCIVNSAGAWASQVANLAGLRVPVLALKHSYVVSNKMPSVVGLPNIKDSDGRIYFRVKGESLCMGGFEYNPIIVEKMPEDHAFTLFELDWKVFESHMQQAMEMVPSFETAGVETTVCGSECFTPDLKPLVGEDPRLRGFFHNCGFNAGGVVLGGGCGEQLAQWIIDGRPAVHMYPFDIRRFTPEQMENKTWCKERCHESYVNNYKIYFPHDEPLAGRNLKQDPFHEELLVAGAVFEEEQAYERPGWFNPQGYAPIPPYDWYGAYGFTRNMDKRYLNLLKGDRTFGFSKHHLAIGSECLACREEVVLMDFSYFCKLYMVGPETQKAADWLFSADTDVPIGKAVYSCLLNKRGGIEADLLVTPITSGSGTQADPIFKGLGMFIVAGGASASQTRAHIKSVLGEEGFEVDIFDFSAKVGLLAVQGPASREMLQPLVDCDLSDELFPYSTSKIIRLGGHQVRAMRTSFVGELGWEIHIPWHSCLPVYLALWEQGKKFGLRHAGYRALYSLCSEKGYRLWNSDVRSDDNPIEAGLGFSCRRDGGAYLGKEAVEMARQEGIKKRHVFLTIADQVPLHGLETIWRDDRIVGYLRRGEYGFSLGCAIGQGYVQDPDGKLITDEFLTTGKYEIEVMGVRHSAKLHLKSPFDPHNKRLHGIYDEPLPVREAFAQ